MRRLGMMAVALAAGCAPPLAGPWSGTMDCAGIAWTMNMVLDWDGGNTFVGDGEQQREFTDNETGNITEITITFSADVEAREGNAAQQLDATLSCTNEETINYLAGRTEPTVVDATCQPARYQGYTMSWDGADALTVKGNDRCKATLSRPGTR
ncbi:MAG: hypothetical protein H6733_15345 [Alphaproteobacteria bacterium]|nr:hypothetical protein [Alphaproteobacteria bacterium]